MIRKFKDGHLQLVPTLTGRFMVYVSRRGVHDATWTGQWLKKSTNKRRAWRIARKLFREIYKVRTSRLAG